MNQKKELTIDDLRALRAGRYVTVLHGLRLVDGTEDQSYRGHVLVVLAVDAPFVSLRRIDCGHSYEFSLDTRQGWTFQALSKRYAESLIRTEEPATPKVSCGFRGWLRRIIK